MTRAYKFRPDAGRPGFFKRGWRRFEQGMGILSDQEREQPLAVERDLPDELNVILAVRSSALEERYPGGTVELSFGAQWGARGPGNRRLVRNGWGGP